MKTNLVNKTALSLAVSVALLGMNTANADNTTCDDNGCKTTSFEFETEGAPKSKLDLIIATTKTDNKTNASGNTVTIKNTSKIPPFKEARSIYGAYRDDNTTAENNKVVMSGGTVRRDTQTVGSNAYVVGARSDGDVINNSVTISDNAKLDFPYGTKKANAFLLGGMSKSGVAKSNVVTINGGTLNIKEVIGGNSISGDADSNTVVINSGTVNLGGEDSPSGMIAGGRAEKNLTNEKGSSKNNTVKITGGTIEDFGSKYTKIVGGWGYDVVENNSVEITGGKINADVYGGYSFLGEANNNTVTIKKGSKGNPTFGDETILGGYVKREKSGSSSNSTPANEDGKNNTLNLHTTGLTAKNIKNFNNLNFYVQKDTQPNAKFITLTDSADTDITKAKISVGVEGDVAPLNIGDKLTLIEKQGGSLLTGDLTNYKGDKTVTGMQGIAATYNFKLKKEGENLIAETTEAKEDPNYKPTPTEPTTPVKPTPTEPTTPVKPTPTEPTTPVKPTAQQEIARVAGKVHPQTKSLLESALSSVNFVNTGADLLSKQGMHQLTRVHNKSQDGLHVFGAVAGSDLITETGSEIDVRGTTLLVGVGKQLPNKMGKLHVGGFVEGGKGIYDTYNKLSDNTSVIAEGDSKYVGFGAMLKQEYSNGAFAEASARFGNSDTNYNSYDLKNSQGYTNVNYDIKRNYTGVNLGVGGQLELNKKVTAVPSAKLLYTKFNSAEKLIKGSTFKFDEISSLRSQLGADIIYQATDTTDIYTNAVWEREYDGQANGKVLGLNMPAPSLEGDTGIVGAGIHFAPRKNIDINMDVKGSFGKREGGEVGMSFKYKF